MFLDAWLDKVLNIIGKPHDAEEERDNHSLALRRKQAAATREWSVREMRKGKRDKDEAGDVLAELAAKRVRCLECEEAIGYFNTDTCPGCFGEFCRDHLKPVDSGVGDGSRYCKLCREAGLGKGNVG